MSCTCLSIGVGLVPSKGLVVLGSNKTLGPQCGTECLHTVHGTLG